MRDNFSKREFFTVNNYSIDITIFPLKNKHKFFSK